MHDVPLLQVSQRGQQLRAHLRSLRLRKPPPLLQPRVEVPAVRKLQHHVQVPRVLEVRLQPDYVFMLELFHDEYFVGELLVEFLALCLGLRDGFERVLLAGLAGAHLADSSERA